MSEPPPDEHPLRVRAKAELRRRMRSVRRVIPADARNERAKALTERVIALDAYARARTIAGYVAVRGEADPAGVLSHALEAGKTVALPRVDSEAGIVLHRWTDETALAESEHGIPEPPDTSETVANDTIDLVLVPALSVDARGHRIGSGYGYYDRLLPKLTRAHKLGFVYDFQLLAELPDTAGDVPLDGVVTDRRLLLV